MTEERSATIGKWSPDQGEASRPASLGRGTEARNGSTASATTPGSSPAPAEPRLGQAARTPSRAAATAANARARRARLVLSRVDPWSVMKLGFLLSLALAIIFLTAIAVLWTTLDALGVFDTVTKTAGDLTRGDAGGGVNLTSFLALRRVMGAATIVAMVNVALLTALSTLGAFLYNLATSLVGGLQVTLTEES